MCVCVLYVHTLETVYRSHPWAKNIWLGERLAEVKYNSESNVLMVWAAILGLPQMTAMQR